jgi:peptidoglycan/LPS O-acetylase OafA/YrhL
MTDKQYHHEIDGLRAVSVLVIILFHLDITAFSGGFIGVDIFFVISGYLITRIVVSNLDAGRFSYKDFYIRRATRILPALFATIALILPVAMYLQQPAALVHTAQESIYALFSLSNIFYWTESSYWSPSAEKYVLLHTWSLGVEEQFYLVYPLLLVLAHRVAGARGVVALLAVTAILGTVATEIYVRIDHSAAFFLMPLRFYEFAFGGLAAVLPGLIAMQRSSWLSGAATATGLALITYACLRFNGLIAPPGVRMLVPVMGALLVLLAGPSPIAKILLINPIMSWIGKVSYSLYLTHWPIIVFYRYFFGSHLTLTEQSGLFVLILLTGYLLNIAVERRYRLSHDGKTTAGGVSSSTVLTGTLAAAVLVLMTSALLIASKGWPSRMPEGTEALQQISPYDEMTIRKKFMQEHCQPEGENFCGTRDPEATNILLLGDSRVLDIYMALETAYPNANIQASYAMGCPAVLSPKFSSRFFPNCAQFNQSRLQAALDAPQSDIVFFAQMVNEWRAGAVLATVKRFTDAGKTVYVLGDFDFITNTSPIEISIDLLRFDTQGGNIEKYLDKYPFKLDGEFADQLARMGAVYISNRNFFYDGQYHLTDRDTGELLTLDGTHLSNHGARQFGEYLREHYPLP